MTQPKTAYYWLDDCSKSDRLCMGVNYTQILILWILCIGVIPISIGI